MSEWVNTYYPIARKPVFFLQNLCLLFPMSSLSNCFPDSSYSSVRSPTVAIRSNASRTNLINLSDILCLVSLDQNQTFLNLSSLCFYRAKTLTASSVVSRLSPLSCQSLCSQPRLMPQKCSAKGCFPMKSNWNNTVTTILTHCRCLVTLVTCESKFLNKPIPVFMS